MEGAGTHRSLQLDRVRDGGHGATRRGEAAAGAVDDAAMATAMNATTHRDPVTLFGRHLDLAPLRHHRHGLVRCIFHEDRTGSLSVDLDKGVFHCFGCGAQGGMRDFAVRVGEARENQDQLILVKPGVQPGATPMLTAFAEALGRDRQQTARMEKWAPVFRSADVIRSLERVVDTLRARATAAGPDGPTTWDLLERAARIERDVERLDMDFDVARREASRR
jgi:hypothetical protein